MGECTYPKMVPLVLTHSQTRQNQTKQSPLSNAWPTAGPPHHHTRLIGPVVARVNGQAVWRTAEPRSARGLALDHVDPLINFTATHFLSELASRNLLITSMVFPKKHTVHELRESEVIRKQKTVCLESRKPTKKRPP